MNLIRVVILLLQKRRNQGKLVFPGLPGLDNNTSGGGVRINCYCLPWWWHNHITLQHGRVFQGFLSRAARYYCHVLLRGLLNLHHYHRRRALQRKRMCQSATGIQYAFRVHVSTPDFMPFQGGGSHTTDIFTGERAFIMTGGKNTVVIRKPGIRPR